MKEKLHIIPHTHWDREWYMSFEQHRFRLVELLDTLIDLMEENQEFRYYHLDGQTIILRDYLEIRPEKRDALLRLLREGRIQTGPWYILQDEYLVSGEATVRNLQTGLRDCKSFGIEPVMTGYFPDAFGNIGQAPQILQGFGIDTAVFGRGVNVMGADNQVMDQSAAAGSEMIWQSPDGSEVLGVMFVNWYHNAMELPTDPEQAKQRLEKLLESTRKFAKTPHLLGMNGCDHQPVQRDLPAAVAVLQQLAPDVEIAISNFKDYLEAVRPYRDRLNTVFGELAGQHTAGWGLLENTASSRIDLKIKNHKAQNNLERTAEPFGVLAALHGGTYDRDFLRYSWETLMENHPHDSICCCSVDSVHKEMDVRFDKSLQVSELLTGRALAHLTAQMDTVSLQGQLIAVFNKEPFPVTGRVEAFVDFPEDSNPGQLSLFDAQGRPVPAVFQNIGRTFTYTLPDDRFRKVRYVNRFSVSFVAGEVPALGWNVYAVREEHAAAVSADFACGDRWAENEFLRMEITENGTLNLLNKRSEKQFQNFLWLEDAPDAGNEYTYRLPENGIIRTTKADRPEIETAEQTPFSATFRVVYRMPEAAEIYVTLSAGIPRVDVRAVLENRRENHRIRACFDTELKTGDVYADGQFDVVRRDIIPWEGWQNPLHTQRHQHFFELTDGENGVIIAGRGLHEYEILPEKNTMALTLLRAIDQLGDWGVFPTPDSQMKGILTAEFSIILSAGDDRPAAHRQACAFSEMALISAPLERHEGTLPCHHSMFSLTGDYLRLSALKRCEDRDSTLVRFYNTDDSAQEAVLRVPPVFGKAYLTNLAEERQKEVPIQNGEIRLTVPKKKIITLELL